ncbi:major facilitator superfamily domain-containing protein 12-like isoform X1 [Salvia hispanica]|uniref:major facilitator superfamily domain-containing protein 12-like isoform X1 n=2 Tax=Salvia hispanica TaxID=49212 RepID=UPI0020097AC5|nr:major facilitator superfamily domain-containing protein 12-like isoform X1 [Salvia hispanica]XP_047951410.1 major facilitator superfamily domain-containing protein 12-like isoform X1 [Salvia hispanica]XP_047951411.1 major facilitator superfamily domain-containing protein 12-like isoform X1 [Salvia hispanica]
MTRGSTDDDDDSCTRPVKRWSIFFYGVGHMLNDVTSACWFTYLLVFLTDIGLPPSDAAMVMLSGQIADGFMTIFAGELIDRYGSFKIWHGAGSILVAVSFSSVFGGCMPCKIIGSYSSTAQTISYSLFAAIFNVGWAATQVSHMSMVNCITLNSTSRVVMTSCRNAFTMVANLSLYAVAFVVFKFDTRRTIIEVEHQYRWIAYASIFIGCCFVGIFHLGTAEPRLKREAHEKGYTRISWTYWFRKLLYHQVALVYVLTRLVTNVSQAFLAFYVVNELRMDQSAKALVPAVIYVCSFVTSIILQEMAWNSHRLKVSYSAGGLLWMISGVGILFLPSSMKYFMYLISVVIGVANALMMVSGVSMQSFLVGRDLNGCAFVYGSLSFLDKIICGVALSVLESYQSSTPDEVRNCNPVFSLSITRYGLGLVPAISALVGVLVTLSMKLPEPTLTPLIAPLLE